MPPPKKQLIKGLLTSIVPSRGPKRALFLGRHLCFFGGSPAEIPEQNILPKSFTGLAIVSQGWPVGHSFTGAIVSESSCWIHPNQLLGEDFINFPPTSLVFTPLPKLENLGFFRIRFFFQKKTWKHIFPQMLVEFKGDLPWSNPQQHHQKNKSKKGPQSLFFNWKRVAVKPRRVLWHNGHKGLLVETAKKVPRIRVLSRLWIKKTYIQWSFLVPSIGGR